MESLITIDPGFGGTGYAVWSVGSFRLMDHGVLRPLRSGAIERRGASLWRLVIKLFTGIKPAHVVIEWPEFFASTGLGHSAAGRGDLGKLYYAAAIAASAGHAVEAEVMCVPVRRWKGQLSKEQVEWRVRKHIDQRFPNHALDAVGLGLYLQGKL